MTASGTKRSQPMWAACPVLAKADTRPAYRADVSLARLSPPCRWVLRSSRARLCPCRASAMSMRLRKPPRLNATTGARSSGAEAI